MNVYCVLYECVLPVFFMNVYYVLYECALTMFCMNVYWLYSLLMFYCVLYECVPTVFNECVLTGFFMNEYCVHYECVLPVLFVSVYWLCSLWMCTDRGGERYRGISSRLKYFVTLCSRLNRLTRFCTVPHFLCPPRQWLDLRNDPRLSRSDPCHPIDLWTLLTFSVPLQTP